MNFKHFQRNRTSHLDILSTVFVIGVSVFTSSLGSWKGHAIITGALPPYLSWNELQLIIGTMNPFISPVPPPPHVTEWLPTHYHNDANLNNQPLVVIASKY